MDFKRRVQEVPSAVLLVFSELLSVPDEPSPVVGRDWVAALKDISDTKKWVGNGCDVSSGTSVTTTFSVTLNSLITTITSAHAPCLGSTQPRHPSAISCHSLDVALIPGCPTTHAVLLIDRSHNETVPLSRRAVMYKPTKEASREVWYGELAGTCAVRTEHWSGWPTVAPGELMIPSPPQEAGLWSGAAVLSDCGLVGMAHGPFGWHAEHFACVVPFQAIAKCIEEHRRELSHLTDCPAYTEKAGTIFRLPYCRVDGDQHGSGEKPVDAGDADAAARATTEEL